MGSNFRGKPAPRHRGNPAQSSSPIGGSSYAPSVPISVYRELSAELQATRAMLEALNHHNQVLVQQNQQMRSQIDRLVQSALELRQIADSQSSRMKSLPEGNAISIEVHPEFSPEVEAIPVLPERPNLPSPNLPPMPYLQQPSPSNGTFGSFSSDLRPEPFLPFPGEIIAEIEEPKPHRRSPSARSAHKPAKQADLTGLWLILIVVVLVTSAFGAGFILVQPFLPKNR